MLLATRMIALSRNFWVVLLAGLIAQLTLIWFGTASGDPFGDVRYIYDAWVSNMVTGSYLLGITDPWVYPYPAQLPLWLAHWISAGDYVSGWYLAVVNTNMLLFAYLLGWGKKMERANAVWFYIGCVFLIGPVAIARLEVFSVALTLMGLVAFYENKQSKSIQFFNLATWIKVSPFAILASLFIVTGQKKKFVLNIAIATAVILAIGLLLGGNSSMFSFVTMQSGRGIQVESTVAIIWLVQILLGVPGVRTYYDNEIVTFQVQGFGVNEVASIMTFVQFGALAITILLGFRAKRMGTDLNTLFGWLILTATLDLLIFNKVGSTQYQMWVVSVVFFGVLAKIPNWKMVTYITLATSLLSWLIFPVFYGDLLDGKPLGVGLIVLRNLGLIAILVYANMQLFRLGKKQTTE
ncbi:MAG: hypothetical protein EBR26_00460 [Microbacteriaceae bacterium]|nr:hypothetical protein [Microbacteriaceae bacterium]